MRRGSRDTRRFGRRSSGGGSFGQVWPGVNYRATINDNMLVIVMIETLEGVANAEEIAATHGVDVVILGNNDLSSFSGWSQNDPRYQDALIKVHDAALKYGKYYGNAGAQYLNGYTVTADTRLVQNGPARDALDAATRRGGGAGRGAAPAGRGRGDNAPDRMPSRSSGCPAVVSRGPACVRVLAVATVAGVVFSASGTSSHAQNGRTSGPILEWPTLCKWHGRLQTDLPCASRRRESSCRARWYVQRTQWRCGRIGCRELARLAAARRCSERQAVCRRRLRALQRHAVVVRTEAIPGSARHEVTGSETSL